MTEVSGAVRQGVTVALRRARFEAMTTLNEKWRTNRDRVRLMGEAAIAQAHAAGVAAYYRDVTGSIVRHDPDGTRTPVVPQPRILQSGAAPSPRVARAG